MSKFDRANFEQMARAAMFYTICHGEYLPIMDIIHPSIETNQEIKKKFANVEAADREEYDETHLDQFFSLEPFNHYNIDDTRDDGIIPFELVNTSIGGEEGGAAGGGNEVKLKCEHIGNIDMDGFITDEPDSDAEDVDQIVDTGLPPSRKQITKEKTLKEWLRATTPLRKKKSTICRTRVDAIIELETISRDDITRRPELIKTIDTHNFKICKEDLLFNLNKWSNELQSKRKLTPLNNIEIKELIKNAPNAPPLFKLKSDEEGLRNQYILGAIPGIYTKMHDWIGDEDSQSMFSSHSAQEFISQISTNNIILRDTGRGGDDVPEGASSIIAGRIYDGVRPTLYKPGDTVPNLTLSFFIEHPNQEGPMGVWDLSNKGTFAIETLSHKLNDIELKRKIMNYHKHTFDYKTAIARAKDYIPLLNINIPLSLLCELVIPNGGVLILPVCFPVRPQIRLHLLPNNPLYLPVVYNGIIHKVFVQITKMITNIQHKLLRPIPIQDDLGLGPYIWDISSSGDNKDFSDQHLYRSRGDIVKLERQTALKRLKFLKEYVTTLRRVTVDESSGPTTRSVHEQIEVLINDITTYTLGAMKPPPSTAALSDAITEDRAIKNIIESENIKILLQKMYELEEILSKKKEEVPVPETGAATKISQGGGNYITHFKKKIKITSKRKWSLNKIKKISKRRLRRISKKRSKIRSRIIFKKRSKQRSGRTSKRRSKRRSGRISKKRSKIRSKRRSRRNNQ